MRKTKRFFAAVLALTLIASTLTGCGVVDKITGIFHRSDSTYHSKQTDPDNTKLGEVDKSEEGVIVYNGQGYKYNHNLDVYLMLGVDKEGEVESAKNYRDGGQSDAMFLLVADHEKETLSVVAINRNTMTDIYTCDEDDNYTGEAFAQICVQHGFGDGKRTSCTRTLKTVSKLFYNLPIKGYFAINMGGIAAMNSSVEGVEVTVLEDLVNVEKKVDLKKGEKKTLTDNEAYVYVRSRNTNEFGSSDKRLERQKQFINGFLDKIRFSEDRNAIYRKMYYDLMPYMVTNMELLDVLDEIVDYRYSDAAMYTIPGETVMGEKYEEFYVDEEAFYEMILKVFYVPVED